MSAKSRTIGVVTVSRADYAICRPVLRLIASDPDLSLHLMVSGMHVSAAHGMTVCAIEADGFPIGDRVEMLVSADGPDGIAKSMGLGTIGFAQIFSRRRPDVLVVLADRFEMFAAALAAVPFNIPIAHIEGGDLTEGAFDDALRHSLTKLSHLHFVSTETAAARVRQLGEEPWRVVVSGAPSLDNMEASRLRTAEELERHYGVKFEPAPLLVTFHPVTREIGDVRRQITELLGAIEEAGRPAIFTGANADTHGHIVSEEIARFVQANSSARFVENFGTEDYWSVMAHAGAMVGNSSSGLIEAPSLKLPVVNVGERQRGRVRAGNVIDVGNTREEIVRGIRRALDPGFRAGLQRLWNPYGSGHAAEVIVNRLKAVDLHDSRLLSKRFHDLQAAPGGHAVNSCSRCAA